MTQTKGQLMGKDDNFDKVMKGLRTKGDSNAERAEADKRRARGEAQAVTDRNRRDTQRKINERKQRNDDGVVDTGMFR